MAERNKNGEQSDEHGSATQVKRAHREKLSVTQLTEIPRLFPSVLPTSFFYAFLVSPMLLHATACYLSVKHVLFVFIILMIFWA